MSTNISTEKTILITSTQTAKPFKVGTLFFYSKPHYSKYRDSLIESERKKFKAVPALRAELEKNRIDLNAKIRYLTTEEIREGE